MGCCSWWWVCLVAGLVPVGVILKIYVMVTSDLQFFLEHQTIARYTYVLFTSNGQSERLGLLLFVTPNSSFFQLYLYNEGCMFQQNTRLVWGDQKLHYSSGSQYMVLKETKPLSISTHNIFWTEIPETFFIMCLYLIGNWFHSWLIPGLLCV